MYINYLVSYVTIFYGLHEVTFVVTVVRSIKDFVRNLCTKVATSNLAMWVKFHPIAKD